MRFWIFFVALIFFVILHCAYLSVSYFLKTWLSKKKKNRWLKNFLYMCVISHHSVHCLNSVSQKKFSKFYCLIEFKKAEERNTKSEFSVKLNTFKYTKFSTLLLDVCLRWLFILLNFNKILRFLISQICYFFYFLILIYIEQLNSDKVLIKKLTDGEVEPF